MDSSGISYLNNDKCLMDSIPNKIVSSFFDINNYYRNREVRFNWHTKTPSDSINKVFNKISLGYFLAYNKLSKEKFNNTPICKLTKSHLSMIKYEMPIIVRLGEIEISFPPLPSMPN